MRSTSPAGTRTCEISTTAWSLPTAPSRSVSSASDAAGSTPAVGSSREASHERGAGRRELAEGRVVTREALGVAEDRAGQREQPHSDDGG